MNVVIITQDDPFYLAENLDYLFNNLPNGVNVTGCVVSSVSPFGKKESFLKKAKKSLEIFGWNFFVRYSLRFLRSKFDKSRSVREVLSRHNVDEIFLQGSINSDKSLRAIEGAKPDLLISIAGNEIFRKPLIDLAPHGCLNLHTALLPKYRGLMPSFWVLKNNETHTGVSVFFVDEGIDSGPIHVQKKIEIGDMSQSALIEYSKRLGMEAIIESVSRIIDGDMNTMPNPKENGSYYKFPNRDDVNTFLAIGKKFF
ncbi:methionyl-tRNA formyltransferase [Ferrimonas sp. SCSIO 43195]|uniref:methionyl-tRNA formyltransferase n=1 Tax=Ferrimonas sp. SCSIO 43195 TaxID=2822844 RepID=UPI0020756A74|nr:formyltransferase family protein [Ferrimonas sp. SCSIO 43195]USD38675.1 hypothetical protein J8Z22_06100 [Ferrimonas sp. SCSIO 43195]